MHLAPSSKIAPAPPPEAAQLTPRGTGGLVLKPPSIAAQPQVPLAEKFSSSSYQKQQQPPPSPAPAPPPPPPKEEPEYSEPPPPQPVVEEPPPAEPEAQKPLPPPIVVQSSQAMMSEKLRVFVGTWNLHGKEPEADLSPWLGDPTAHPESAPDVFAIGTQEAERGIQASVLRPKKAVWQSHLEAALGDGYQCIGSQTLVAIHLAVFVKASLVDLISNVQTGYHGTGLGGTLGNKGGTALAMTIGKTSFLFVNAHFAAHQKKVEQRNADFHNIDAKLQLWPGIVDESSTVDNGVPYSAPASMRMTTFDEPPPPPPPPSPPGSADEADAESDDGEDLAGDDPVVVRQYSAPTRENSCSTRFDRAFFFGDLNYRINGTRESVDKLLAPADDVTKSSADWKGDAEYWAACRETLLASDQLRMAMASGRAFPGFAEGELLFRPTYKFDKKQPDEYDQSEKRRIPAYTDRVLFKPPPRADWPAAKPVPLPPPPFVGAPDVSDPSGSGINGTAASSEEQVIKLTRYDAVASMRSSDHKPVVAEFEVRIDRPAGIPLSRSESSKRMRARHSLARSGTGSFSMNNGGRMVEEPPGVRRSSSAGGKVSSQQESTLCAVM